MVGGTASTVITWGGWGTPSGGKSPLEGATDAHLSSRIRLAVMKFALVLRKGLCASRRKESYFEFQPQRSVEAYLKHLASCRSKGYADNVF